MSKLETTKKQITQAEFNKRLVEILGNDEFFLTDMIWQERLFEIQSQLSNLIVETYNSGSNVPLAKMFVKKCKETFYIG